MPRVPGRGSGDSGFRERGASGATIVRGTGGFTLIELLVAIAVMAIVLVAGVPGFQALVNGNRLAASSNEMIANLQTARMEAIRRNRRVVVCASANANAGPSASCPKDRKSGG